MLYFLLVNSYFIELKIVLDQKNQFNIHLWFFRFKNIYVYLLMWGWNWTMYIQRWVLYFTKHF